MSANKLAADVGIATGLGYHTARIAINRLVNNGWGSQWDAAQFVQAHGGTHEQLETAIARELERLRSHES